MSTATTANADPFADDFADPKTGFDNLKDYAGELVIVKVTNYETGIITEYTPKGEVSSVVDIDFIVLTGDDAGKEVTGCRIFPKGLVGQLRAALGKAPVLGRVTKTAQFKKGTGWVFNAASDEDKAFARKFLQDRKEAQIKAQAAKAAEDPFA